MSGIIKIKHSKPSLLEQFGAYYLGFFLKSTVSIDKWNDNALNIAQRRIVLTGILLSALISIIFVLPVVWIDLYFQGESFFIHYGWIAIASLISIILELYFLFLIALKLVSDISKLVNIDSDVSDFMKEGLFSIRNVLARAALELPDPEMEILGINPFKQISKKNLLVISLLYKAKIILTNLFLKAIFIFLSVNTIFGFSIHYEAVIVEIFWNSIIIFRVIGEARLRLFGFALSIEITRRLEKSKLLNQLSEEAKEGCLRAIGNAVVMTQNYHPNMIILLLSFHKLLGIENGEKYDEWLLFMTSIQKVSPKERYFLLDLFTVAAAFDGKVSLLEKKHLKDAYGEDYALYYPRLIRLTGNLRKGKLEHAMVDCKLDFSAG